MTPTPEEVLGNLNTQDPVMQKPNFTPPTPKPWMPARPSYFRPPTKKVEHNITGEQLAAEAPELEKRSSCYVFVNEQGKTIEFSLDGIMQEVLREFKRKVLEEEQDLSCAITGKVGVGKSTLMAQIAAYYDPTMCINRVTFLPEDFYDRLLKGRRGQCLIFDEAVVGLQSGDTMGKTSKALVALMTQSRFRGLFTAFIIPSFFSLNKNIAINRTSFLLHVEEKYFKHPDPRDPTKFVVNRTHMAYFYGPERKKDLWILGKKNESMCVKPNFYFKFTSAFPLPKDLYDKAKERAWKISVLRQRAKLPNSGDIPEELLADNNVGVEKLVAWRPPADPKVPEGKEEIDPLIHELALEEARKAQEKDINLFGEVTNDKALG